MRIVEHRLPREHNEAIIVPIGDAHDGDRYADENYINERIEYIKNTPNVYTILCGDLANVATRIGKSDSMSAKYTIDRQLDRQVERFEPIREKILGIVDGNHEGRTYLESGLSYTTSFVRELKLKEVYDPDGLVVIIRVGECNKKMPDLKKYRQVCYSGYITHGKRSGRKEGSKVQAAVDLETVIRTDFYIHAHSHLGAILTGKHLSVNLNNNTLVENEFLYVNLAAALDYGGYAERAEYKPMSKRSPIIYLCGTKKAMDADLGERRSWQ